MSAPVILTVDPALGGGNAVLALALTNAKLYVLDARVNYGFNQVEQIFAVITDMALRYRPYLVMLEIDAQQKGIGNDDRLQKLAKDLGFSVQPHATRQNKHQDPVFNVASMNQSFVREEISIPWGDPEAQRKMEPLVNQLRAWRPDIPTKALRQDAVMALWMGWRYWMQARRAQSKPVRAQWRPSWLVGENVA